MSNSVDPGRAPECFEFDSSDKSSTVVTLREGFTLQGVGPTITVSSSDPSGGVDGDLWIKV